MIEKIEILLDESDKGMEVLTVYPRIDLAVHEVGIKTGMFSSKYENKVMPLSSLEVTVDELKRIEEEQE